MLLLLDYILGINFIEAKNELSMVKEHCLKHSLYIERILDNILQHNIEQVLQIPYTKKKIRRKKCAFSLYLF